MAGDVGNLTDPAWQLGPIKFVGTGGFTWTPAGSSGVQAGATAAGAIASPTGTNATSGQYMMYSGVYGPNGANGLTQSTLGSQLLLHGTLTVPIAQIVTTGDFFIIGSYSNAGGGSPVRLRQWHLHRCRRARMVRPETARTTSLGAIPITIPRSATASP